jgi:hypothetical protein
VKPKPRPPPAKFGFEQALRADPRLNVTVRVGRLMAALSERSGYSSMSLARMAAELKADAKAVRQARQKLVNLGYFDQRPGWRYRRRKLQDGEKRREFWERLRREKRLDLTGRLAFYLSERTEKTGQCEASLAELAAALSTDRHHVRLALRRRNGEGKEIGLLALDDHFRCGKGAGGRNAYSRVWERYQRDQTWTEYDDDGTDDGDEEVVDGRPFAAFSRGGRAGRTRKPAGHAAR